MINYQKIDRHTWQNLFTSSHNPLSNDELEQLKSKNDRIFLSDVNAIYLPLIRYLELYITKYRHLQLDRALFLQQETHHTPFIIGIAGSVAVGKSTTARLLQKLLSQCFPQWKTQLMTTDGFLYSTKELKEKGLLERKGFPESYNMASLLSCLNQIKSGQFTKVPVYSHEKYDIIPNEYLLIEQPDILIVEGINVLQNPDNEQLYVRDFFDFSIYIDAKTEHIERWYKERFDLILESAKHHPKDYYYSLANQSKEVTQDVANSIWESVNKRNLEEYILPTKNRADLILHKSHNHLIDYLFIRKY